MDAMDRLWSRSCCSAYSPSCYTAELPPLIRSRAQQAPAVWRTRTGRLDRAGRRRERDSWPSGVLCTVHPSLHPSIPPSIATRSRAWAAELPRSLVIPSSIHRRPSRACATPLLPTPAWPRRGPTVRRTLTRDAHPVGNTKPLIEPGFDAVAAAAGNNQQDVPPSNCGVRFMH